MRRLFIDIETSFNIGAFWKAGYGLDIDYKNIIRERDIICIAWKWQDEKQIKYLTWDKNQNSREMIKKIIPVLDLADEIIGHNIARYDIPWIKTMAIKYGFPFNPHYRLIDTCVFAQKKLHLNSNKLDYIADFFGIGHKKKTEFDLWKRVVINKEKEALDYMIKYCKWDVVLAEKIYEPISLCMAARTHVGVESGGEKYSCPHCGSARVVCNKTRPTATGILKHQMQCRKCGRYYTISDSTYRRYSK